MFEITRHDPFTTRAMRDLVQLVAGDPFFRASSFPLTEEGALPVDVSEADGEILVRASLPGFDRDDIDVQVHDGVLSIKAEHREEHEEKNEKFYHRERRVGSVSRRVALPGVVTETDATAEFKNGVLTLHIPQAESSRPKQIPIA